MQDRIKEQERDIQLARTQTSTISKHSGNTRHNLLWNEVKFFDRDPPRGKQTETVRIEMHQLQPLKTNQSQ